MELIIDKNGKAVSLEDVSVTIICESKEEADRMREGMADGRVQLVEWRPTEIRNGKVIGAPECRLSGEGVLISYRTDWGEAVTLSGSIQGDEDGCHFFYLDDDVYGLENVPGGIGQDAADTDRVLAWMPMPKPYKPREKEGAKA